MSKNSHFNEITTNPNIIIAMKSKKIFCIALTWMCAIGLWAQVLAGGSVSLPAGSPAGVYAVQIGTLGSTLIRK